MSTQDVTGADLFAPLRGSGNPELEPRSCPDEAGSGGVGGVRKKRTPEQEAYRISRVQAALKGKPATEEQREKRAAGLRKAWAEGRIKPSATPESIEKTAAKLRGRKRPQHVIDAVVRAHTGKRESAETRAKLRAIGLARGTGAFNDPAVRAKAAEKLHEYYKHLSGDPLPPESRAAQAAKLRGRIAKPEHVESRVKPMRGRAQTADATRKGPTNKGSIEGGLRDSCGRIWWFRNLSHFVRTHEDLFDAEDLLWRPVRPGKAALGCNAQKRLLALFGHGKVVPGTWKGWTVADSTIERRQGCADLLGRDEAARELQAFIQANDKTSDSSGGRA